MLSERWLQKQAKARDRARIITLVITQNPTCCTPSEVATAQNGLDSIRAFEARVGVD
jgi:hypothetical protein